VLDVTWEVACQELSIIQSIRLHPSVKGLVSSPGTQLVASEILAREGLAGGEDKALDAGGAGCGRALGRWFGMMGKSAASAAENDAFSDERAVAMLVKGYANEVGKFPVA